MHDYKDYPKPKREYYESMLKIVGSLSRLFSESDIPYLDSRVAENLYCKSFDAQNKSREDSSVDAVYKTTGFGIKTFRGNSSQKIAEFNKDILKFSSLGALDKAKKVAELRNERVNVTKRIYGLEFVKYHCIIREKGKMVICEYPMELIDLDNLTLLKHSDKTVRFKDGKNDYIFNISKSVLMKSFPKQNILVEVRVDILSDPFNILDKALGKHKKDLLKTIGTKYAYVILPLYSVKSGDKIVPERSSLNQWNAEGRKRDYDEVYIKVPLWIHKRFAGFFPSRDTKFIMNLPNGDKLSAKICQDESKALMSDPNKALGKWILRDVLQLKNGELLTYKRLQELGIDSVIIEKAGNLEFNIDFKEEGSYEKFEEENLILN